MRLPTMFAVSAALLCNAGAARAQEGNGANANDQAAVPARSDADSSGDRLEEIIVEGERNDTTLKESAHSIAVVTVDQLRLGTDRDLDELYQHMANVAVEPGTGDLVVRGLGEFGLRNGGGFQGGFRGFVPNLVNFVDGFFTPTRQSLWDARQVELARGPEDFASGGAQGAVSAVSSNAIGSITNGDVTAQWAPEPNDRSLGFAYGGPLTDTFGYRVAGYMRSRDGYMKNTFRDGGDWNSYDEWVGRLHLEWRPFGDDDTVTTFRFEHLKTDESGGAYIVTAAPIDPFDYKTAVDRPARQEL
jgi:iron complex outermembrane recepter protein